MKEALTSAVCAGALAASAWSQCIGDIYVDGRVDGVDLGAMLAYWGPTTSSGASMAADLNFDGFVDGSDLGTLLGSWGACEVIVPQWATLIEPYPNPAVVPSAFSRAAITRTGLAWRVRHAGTGIEMLLVPPGVFQRGCSESIQTPCNGFEVPVHQVTLTQPFYLGRYEVTQAQWMTTMASNPSQFQGFPDSPNRPIEMAPVHLVLQFLSSAGMRLPSEAEWEFACRAGTTTAFHNGSNDEGTIGDISWHSGNASSQTHPVGLKLPNSFGFHDMHGNVSEMTDGCTWSLYSGNPLVDPADPPCATEPPWPFKMFRGGSWNDLAKQRSSYRSPVPCCAGNGPYGPAAGFRAVRDP
jgi:formylglycine-generating enzyme required for sulfatase activity